MKKNLLIAFILMCICVVCAATISGVNLVTESIIEQNQTEKEAKLCKRIFADYEMAKETITENFVSDKISKLVIAADNSENVLGYIYTVSGKNAYGGITLLVGINKNNELVSVQFMENGQSFSSETVDHVDSAYIGGITGDDVSDIDTTCGATFAAKLVQELVSAAFSDVVTRGVA